MTCYCIEVVDANVSFITMATRYVSLYMTIVSFGVGGIVMTFCFLPSKTSINGVFKSHSMDTKDVLSEADINSSVCSSCDEVQASPGPLV